jgi:uncharacterized protein with ParB-like and HNH nuclease domain
MSKTTGKSAHTLSASEVDIEGLFTGSEQLVVPDYQRDYSWKRRQWDDLWDDLRALTDQRETHFLGSIVVIEYKEGGLKRKELVDGQQRVSTIALLLCAIRDKFQEAGEEYEDIPRLINNFLWIESNVSGEKHQKVKLNTYHNTDFKRILEGNPDTVGDSQVKEAYDHFASKVEGCRNDTVEEIRRELIQSVSVVEIKCGSQMSAFRLFESLNDKGLDLGAVDLMKNRIFMEANENASLDESRIKDLWESIMNKLRPELDENYRFFSHYYMSSSKPETNDAVSKRMLHDYTDKLIEGELKEVGMDLEDFLEDMHDVSDLYIDIVNCEVDAGFKKGKLQELNKELESVQIKNNRIRTLLLKIIDKYDETGDVMEALHILEILNTRNKIAGRDSNVSRDRFWSRASSMIDDKEKPNKYLRRLTKERAPNDTVLKQRMVSREFKKNEFTKYILDSIEEDHYMKSGGRGKTISDRSMVDIEHIAPSKAFSAKKYSSWQRYLDCEESEFEEYKKRIGNLTLLEDSPNRRAGDQPYEEKKKMYQTETDFKMTEAVAEEYDEWGIDQIQERSKSLAEIATEIWNFDNV